jgi:hypothetical protein
VSADFIMSSLNLSGKAGNISKCWIMPTTIASS